MKRWSVEEVAGLSRLPRRFGDPRWLRLALSVTLVASVASLAAVGSPSSAGAAPGSHVAAPPVRGDSSTVSTPTSPELGPSAAGAAGISSIVGRPGSSGLHLVRVPSRHGRPGTISLVVAPGQSVMPLRISSPASTRAPGARAFPVPTTTALRVLGGRREVVVPAGGRVPYGEPLTIVATVAATSGHMVVNGGTVHFTENGGSVYGAGSRVASCQSVKVTAGTATCVLSALAPSTTPYRFGASYLPPTRSLIPSSVPVAHEGRVGVSPAIARLRARTGPDPLLAGDRVLTAIVTDASRGSSLPPTGTVDFALGGVPVTCAQGPADLVEQTARSSTASCEVPTPASTSTYSANYVPSAEGFTVPVPASVTVTSTAQPPSAPALSGSARRPMTTGCSTTFATLWGDSGTLTFSPFTSLGGNLASLSVTTPASTGTCSPTSSISFTSGNVSLFGANVTGSGLSGYIADGSPEPQLCFTSGNLSVYSSTASLSGAADLCFSISSASLTGGVVDQLSSATFTTSATVAIGSDVSLSLSSIQFGTGGTLPTSCTLNAPSDVWLYVDGSLGLSLSGYNGSVAASGCYDFTAKSLSLSATITGLSYSAGANGPTLSAPTVTVSATESGGTWSYSAAVTATLTAVMPSGSNLSVLASLTAVNGGFVVGVVADLQDWLGSDAASAWVGYASTAVSSFDTGVTGVGTVSLNQGINFAFALTLSSGVETALADVGLTGITTVVASGSLSSSTVTINISLSAPAGTTLFSTGGTTLVLNSLSLDLTLSETADTVSFSLNATLNTPSDGQSGDGSGSVALSGTLSAGETGGVFGASLSLSVNPSCQGDGWTNAFGITGLDVQCATLAGGVSETGPNVAFSGTILSLPSALQNVIGLQSGAVISFAFELDPFVLSFSITGSCPTCVALEPLTLAGSGAAQLIQVDSASIYIAPTGGTIGQTTYPAGYSLAFSVVLGSPLNVTVNVAASISFSPLSFSFTGTISEINLGGVLAVGPVTIDLSASSSGFTFQFTASLSLSGSWSDSLTRVSGSLSATLSANVSISTSGAFQVGLSFSGSVQGTLEEWVGSTCPWYEAGVPACDPWYWDTLVNASVSVGGALSLSNSGLTVSVTLDGSTYSVTLPFSSAPTPPGAPTPPTPSVQLTASVNPSSWAQQVTFTATVSATSFDGNGTVAFTDNGADIVGCASQALSGSTGSYSATCTVSQPGTTAHLPVGSDSVQALYSGDSNFGSASSSSVAETVNAATPTVAVNLSSSSVTYGQSVTFTAQVSPTDGGGTVDFRQNGTDIPGCTAVSLSQPTGLGFSTYSAAATCTVSTFPAGSYGVEAVYSGDSGSTGGSVNGASSSAANLTITPAPLTVTSNDASMTYGGAYPALSASYSGLVNGDTPTTESAFTTCTSVAASSDAGSYPITCRDTDPNYRVTYDQTGTLTIKPSATSTSLTSSLDPASITQTVIYTATVSPVAPGGGTPTGTVEFLDNGTLIGACNGTKGETLNGSSPDEATCTITYPATGNHSITVDYLRTRDYLASSAGPLGETVDRCHGSTENCNLKGADLQNADLQGKNLQGSNLKDANVAGANLRGDNLQEVNLLGSTATGADFQGADLQGDNLLNAAFSDVNFRGANLTGANLKGADLNGVTWSNTTCPDGTNSNDDGGTCVNNLT